MLDYRQSPHLPSFYLGPGNPTPALTLYPETSPKTLLLGLLLKRSINGSPMARYLTSNLFLFGIKGNKRGVLFGLFARVARCDLSPNSDYLQAESEMAITKPGFISQKKLQDTRKHNGSWGSHFSTFHRRHSNFAL